MSILIKGIEMPTTCESCPCKTADAFGGLGCQATGCIPLRKANQDRPDNCPLVPVQSHGRLVDADALHEELYALEYARENEWLDGVREARGVDAARVALLDAPTIIPAEEE